MMWTGDVPHSITNLGYNKILLCYISSPNWCNIVKELKKKKKKK